MKHVFYIHSYITYIVSLSAVKELKLPECDVVLVYGRGFAQVPPPSYETIIRLDSELMALAQVPTYGERLLIIRWRTTIHRVDGLIRQAVSGEEFIAYLPFTRNFLMQLIVTHQLCAGLNFIEEGLLTYTNSFNKPFNSYFSTTIPGRISRWVKFLNHGNRSLVYRPRGFSSVRLFLLSNEIKMSDVEARVLHELVFPPIADEYRLRDEFILVVDNSPGEQLVTLHTYETVIRQYADFCRMQGAKTLWIRFHPSYNTQLDITNMCETLGLHVRHIPNHVCVESVLFHSVGLTVTALHSSLLFYAALWGHRSYTMLEQVYSIEPEAKGRYQRAMSLPDVFFKYVQRL